MINPEELRIGNIVQSTTGVYLVVASISLSSIMFDRFDMNAVAGTAPLQDLEGITLGPESLNRLGLKKNLHKSSYYSNHIFDFDIRINRVWIANNHQRIYIDNVRFVHQLQNLWFLITGKELKMAENKIS